MDTTTTAATPDAEAEDPEHRDEDWETMVLGPPGPPYIAYAATAAEPVCTEPIYAELVGQWRALGRTVPDAHSTASRHRLLRTL